MNMNRLEFFLEYSFDIETNSAIAEHPESFRLCRVKCRYGEIKAKYYCSLFSTQLSILPIRV